MNILPEEAKAEAFRIMSRHYHHLNTSPWFGKYLQERYPRVAPLAGSDVFSRPPLPLHTPLGILFFLAGRFYGPNFFSLFMGLKSALKWYADYFTKPCPLIFTASLKLLSGVWVTLLRLDTSMECLKRMYTSPQQIFELIYLRKNAYFKLFL
jgi:hypothetical protein